MIDTIIYRVEDVNGIGAYNCGALRAMKQRHIETYETHPNPMHDTKLYDEEVRHEARYFYGFDSMNKLKKWFNLQDRRDMSEIGLTIVLYKVATKYVITSKYQTVFYRDEAEFLTHMELL